jgi:carbamoyltransferase
MTFKFFLGIQSYANADSGASIVRVNSKTRKIDYVCISEERLIRKKHPYTFPINSIKYCLDYFGLKDLKKINYIISDWIKIKKWHRSGPSYNYSEFDYFKEKFKFDIKKIIQIDHHLAHAASVFYTSKFQESSILIADGIGSDLETTSFFKGEGRKIKFIKKYREFGIGTAYGAVTNHILNLGTGGEGKTMGLAPYGSKYRNQIKIRPMLDGIKTDFSSFMKRNPLSDVLNQLNKNLRPNPIKVKHKFCKNKNYLDKYFAGVAFDIQNVAEKTMIHLGKELYKSVKSKNICLAGGVALNSVANKKLLDKSKFKNIFVFPACSDAGISFGAALWGAFNLMKGVNRNNLSFDDAYTGKDYSNNQIEKLLKKFNISYSKKDNYKVAKYIDEGKIIGRCSGRSEYGPRALGNRSILADARSSKMRDYLNLRVKHREVFRPFAPVILEEKNEEYFDLKQPSPFMLLVAKSHKASLIPSAIHVDKTARVQTINKNQNKDLYDLINNFLRITNVPVILNTSFNDAGEPIVETPLDAIICFFQTKLDYLILNDFIIDRKKNSEIRLDKLKKFRASKIQEYEKIAKLKLLNKTSKSEYIKRKKYFTKQAVFYSIINSKEKLLKFIKKNKKNNIALIGTNDHTFVIYKMLKNIIKKIDIGHFQIKKENDYLLEKKLINLKKIRNINEIKKYDVVVISSFEYQTEIKEKLKFVKKNKLFEIYDNSSRSLIDSYLIKNIKTKNKIFKKGVKTSL